MSKRSQGKRRDERRRRAREYRADPPAPPPPPPVDSAPGVGDRGDWTPVVALIVVSAIFAAVSTSQPSPVVTMLRAIAWVALIGATGWGLWEFKLRRNMKALVGLIFLTIVASLMGFLSASAAQQLGLR